MRLVSTVVSRALILAALAPTSCKTPGAGSGTKDATTDQIMARLPPGLAYETVFSDGIEKFVRPYTGNGQVPSVFDGVWWQDDGGQGNEYVFNIRNALWNATTRTLLVTSHAPSSSAFPAGNNQMASTMAFSPNPNAYINGYQIVFAADMKSALLQDTSFTPGSQPVTLQISSDNLPNMTYISDGLWQRSSTDGKTVWQLRRIVKADGTRDTAYNAYLARFGSQATVFVPALVMNGINTPLSLEPSTASPGTAVLIPGDALMNLQTPNLKVGQWCDPTNQSNCFPYCQNTSSGTTAGWGWENNHSCRIDPGVSSGIYLLQAKAAFPIEFNGNPTIVPSYASGGNQAILITNQGMEILSFVQASTSKTGLAQVSVQGLPAAVLNPGTSFSVNLLPGQNETVIHLQIGTSQQPYTLSVNAAAPVDVRLLDATGAGITYEQNLPTHNLIVSGNVQTVILANTGTVATNAQVSLQTITPQVTTRPDLVVDGPAVTYTLASTTALDSFSIPAPAGMVAATLKQMNSQQGTTLTSLPANSYLNGTYQVSITTPGAAGTANCCVAYMTGQLTDFLNAYPGSVGTGPIYAPPYPTTKIVVAFTGNANAPSPQLSYTLQLKSGN